MELRIQTKTTANGSKTTIKKNPVQMTSYTGKGFVTWLQGVGIEKTWGIQAMGNMVRDNSHKHREC